ncbi:stellacyanin-like [Phalaenopsis equestris]|uniref:stellacyanin-like n=1 Tax=Phalaenopsis equestris TaxID=78828 RepID=UPI0009E32D3F|nr:stellacyanin-like [Phalaenopsis equestris]
MAKPLLLSGLVGLTLLLSCEGALFLVGDTAGWDTSADLATWPEARVFSVGDILSFQYSSYHTVNQVDKNGYNTCNTSNAILTSSGGNTTVPLTSVGDKYFICSNVPHCFGGMKLKVTVISNQTASPPVAASPELSPSTTLPRSSSTTTNANLLPPESNGVDRGGRSHALFISLCFTFGALWWWLMKF